MKKNCKICKKYSLCKSPCEWLKKELKKIEIPKEFLTHTELGIIDPSLEYCDFENESTIEEEL